ncbi:MAG TPA: TrmO family methyltransferase, partial [Myxococcota bacterium]|nr:TrmO family methyltransferase [Myxococcota bacterium]
RDGVERGVFATRSPHRPNPLGISIVKLLRREGSRLLSPAGQRLVLRGSYADEATARVALARMQARPPEVLQGLAGPILDWELEGSQAEALPPFRDRFFRLQPRGRDGVIPLPLYSLQLQSGLPLFRAPKSLYVGSSGDVQVGPVQLPDGPVELVGLSYVLGEEAESRVQRVLGEEAEVEVRLPFAKGESIVGQVVGADGSGQPYASVQVGYQSFTADDQGYFRVGPVGVGIEILSSGGAEDFVALPGVELRLVVPPTETTVVEVVDPDGRPVPGIEVEFFAVHRPVAVAFSDSDGRAQVEGPAGLRARVRLPSTGQAVVGSGRLSLPGRARIEGRVQEADGSPASFVDVEVQPALSEAPVGLAADGVQAGGRSYYLRTGPDGSFALEESPLGALRVRATAADGRQVEGQSEGGQVALLFPSPGLRTVRVEVEAPGRRCLQVAADGGEPVPVEEGVAMLQLARGQLQVRLRLDFEGEG